jgi:hypothetical protein
MGRALTGSLRKDAPVALEQVEGRNRKKKTAAAPRTDRFHMVAPAKVFPDLRKRCPPGLYSHVIELDESNLSCGLSSRKGMMHKFETLHVLIL